MFDALPITPFLPNQPDGEEQGVPSDVLSTQVPVGKGAETRTVTTPLAGENGKASTAPIVLSIISLNSVDSLRGDLMGEDVK